MIEIATSKASLDLPNDAKITIKQKSSLFTILEKEDKQSYSYPFTLPLSSNNNRIISNILEEQKEETLQAVIRKNGVRLFKADLIITERTNTNYEVALQLNKKVDLFNKKMNTLFDELGTFFITEDNHFVDLELRSFALIFTPSWGSYTGSITAIVSGISYTVSNTWDNLLSDLASAINADRVNNNAIATVDGLTKIKIERDNSTLPFFAYSDNMQTTNNTTEPILGFFPYPKDVVDNRQAAETHVNTIDALVDFRDSPYCFPMFLVDMETSSSFPFVIVNAYNQTTNLYQYYQDAVFLPNIRITAVIEKVLSLEGWTLDSTFLKDLEIEKLFLLNPYAIAHKNSGNWDIEQYLQFFWADCLPDISISELITEIQTQFCLNVNWDHTRKILKIESANSIISKKLAKQYECTPFFSEKTKDKQTGYTLKYNKPEIETDLEVNTAFLNSKILENGTEEIVSNFPFLPLYQAISSIPAFPFLLGGLKMPNSFAKFGYVQGFDLYISKNFWLKEGIVKSINFISYIDKQAKFQTDNYSLLWETLYEQFYKNYLNLLDNSEVEREIIYKFSDLQGIDLTELIRLEYSNYFIKDIEYTLTNNEQIRILAKVNLIKTI